MISLKLRLIKIRIRKWSFFRSEEKKNIKRLSFFVMVDVGREGDNKWAKTEIAHAYRHFVWQHAHAWQSRFLSLSLTHTHTQTQALSHTHTHSHTHTIYRSHIQTHTHTFSYTRTLSLFQIHTNTLAHIKQTRFNAIGTKNGYYLLLIPHWAPPPYCQKKL